jgi:micrococcal nuclease
MPESAEPNAATSAQGCGPCDVLRRKASRRWARAATVATALLAAPVVSPAAAQTLSGTVARVGDGDTIHVRVRGVDDTVRLIAIDTPETHRPGYPVQCFGPAASARTARLLPLGTAVRLETDPTQDTRDPYARLLAYVFKTGRSGALGSLNYALVASGHARVYIYGGRPFRYASAFKRAQSQASARNLGLWGPPCRGNTTQPDPSVRRPMHR